MSSTSESSENSRTLPRAELNPLLNPVLASHMGRWAEVYFTSPPEKREEAVLELLRELESEEPATSSARPLESMQATRYVEPTHGNGKSAAPLEPLLAHCQRCGHDNPMTHQFCGMCGSSLQTEAVEGFSTDTPYGQHEGEMEQRESNVPAHPPQQSFSESYVDEPREPVGRSRSDPYDLSFLQGLREREINDYEYDEPSAPRYRYYIGAVLIILLLTLGYMAWRSGQFSQSTHQTSAPPPPAPTESTPAVQPSPSATTAPAPLAPAKVAEPAAPPAGTKTPETAKEQKPESVSPTRPLASAQNSPASSSSATSASTEPQSALTSGAEDFAMAQRYLAGNNGQARDPAEAAKWLWKAMGKHNGPATLQLADLYLKGEGVTKNCEQARVLLDSAAIRGMKGAGERLRNLQAFGCQ